MTEAFNRKNNIKRHHPLTNLMKNTILKIEQEQNRQNFIDKILNQYNSNKKVTPEKFHINLHKSPIPHKKMSKRPSNEQNKKVLQQIMEKQRLSVDNLRRDHKKISQKTDKQANPKQLILIKSLSQKKHRQISCDHILPLQSRISHESDQASKYKIIISYRGNEDNQNDINLRRSQCIDNCEVKIKIQKIKSESDRDSLQAINNKI